ncbi:MAG TPA: endonuclease/exonuclease/phosphatase family protein [Frankiaceae bacterium]|nr:endonuclease/exonuclease/phosphatase family protein [Frankiaceae bacterium]
MTELRVLSYNVLSLRLGLDRVAAVVRACEPDVVCVQEAPRFWAWRAKCARLALECGLRVVTGGRPAAANLLLARRDLRVVEGRSVRLRWRPPLHRRGVAIGVLDVGGGPFVVASTHLSLDDGERLAQARQVAAIVTRYGAPAVLAGDVNEDPDGPAFGHLAGTFADAYAAAPDGDGLTSTARHPRRRIDAVFVDRRLRVVRCGVPAVAGVEDASDHRPLLAVVEVP